VVAYLVLAALNPVIVLSILPGMEVSMEVGDEKLNF